MRKKTPERGNQNVRRLMQAEKKRTNYYYAQWVWICTMGVDFAFFSFILPLFPRSFSG
jgi:hypothetical protein